MALRLVDNSSAGWLGLYRAPLPIRSRGAFHLVSARRLEDDQLAVVVVPGPTATTERVADALAEVERVHQLLDHPAIPKVVRRGAARGVPFLELGCDAVIDGIEALRLIGESERKVPYAQADALLTGMREAAQAGHRVLDPKTGAPICLGRFSYGNMLFSRSGRWFLIGFGRNFPTEKDSSAPDGLTPVFVAPEVAAGAPPTPVGDYVALLMFGRGFLPYVDMAGPVARVLRGEAGASEAELMANIRWFEQRLVGEAPHARATVQEGIAMSQRIREILGVELDAGGFRRYVAELVAQMDEAPLQPANAGTVVLGPQATWLTDGVGARQRLGPALRRIVAALADGHRQRPGEPLSVWELLEAGWPGERPDPEAGANRVYVAIARLRAMGLRHVLERFDAGYRIDPKAVVRSVTNDGGE